MIEQPATLAGDDWCLQRGCAARHLGDVVRLQHAAYAANRLLLGVEPMPLQADYAERFRNCEVWVLPQAASPDDILAALILDTNRADDVLIWSVASDPDKQRSGLGSILLAAAETRARQLQRTRIRLYTGQPLQHLVDWYGRKGYVTERIEKLADRSLVHMIKFID